jgi:hypothetical protein
MDFESLIARVGKPTLFSVIATGKNGLIAKALDTQRPEAVSPAEQVSTLKDISMYTQEGEEPLRNVFASLSNKFQGQQAPSHKADMKELKSIFAEMLPNYDTERVYDGDIRKVFKWYNQLVSNGFNSEGAFAAKTESAQSESPAEEQNTSVSKPAKSTTAKTKAPKK